LQIDTALGSTLNAAQAVSGLAADKVNGHDRGDHGVAAAGVIYHGLEVMGGGSILAGLVLGAIGVFVIERDFRNLGLCLRRRCDDLFRLHAAKPSASGRLGVTPGVALSYRDRRRIVRAGGQHQRKLARIRKCR
jgi:AGZA family xanthine/uracil permease-like MFS transporter